jgi:UDP-N-acetylglucosamine--N-acetylmuramyl-(pentapeptide) pyrophosphoryl-undecaprenol N-acetylglucosamine transferase
VRIIVTGGGTGGHLYPGLAIARALVRADPSVEPFFVGARRGIEREVLPRTEFPHLLLDLHPLYRANPLHNWRTAKGALASWRAIGALVRGERPRAVVGTGGYAAGAMLGYGVAHGIPIMLQEADSHPGLTTRVFSRYAREIFLGFPEGERMLRRGARTQVNAFGNPIEPPPQPLPDKAAARRAWHLDPSLPVLLVFGGSQGSQALNAVVAAWIARGLPDGLQVIWATGRANFEPFASLEGPRVRVRAYLAPITQAYAASDLALTRAGAMTIAELCAWRIPAVLVPLPTAAADHQTANARALAAAGAARNVPQSEFTVDRLDSELRVLLGDSAALARLADAAAARGRPDAAAAIARRILDAVR